MPVEGESATSPLASVHRAGYTQPILPHTLDDPMTTKLSDDLRQAIEKEGGNPVHVVDAATNVHYVLIRADQYEKIRANTGVEEVEAIYPLLAEIEPDDWEDLSHFDHKP
jgi:hypothetical protein